MCASWLPRLPAPPTSIWKVPPSESGRCSQSGGGGAAVCGMVSFSRCHYFVYRNGRVFFFPWFFTVPFLEGEQFSCLRALLRRSLWRGPAHPALRLGVVCPSDDRGGVVAVAHPTLGLVRRIPGSQRKMSGVLPTAHSYHRFPLDPVKQTFSRRNETYRSRNTSMCEHVRPATYSET